MSAELIDGLNISKHILKYPMNVQKILDGKKTDAENFVVHLTHIVKAPLSYITMSIRHHFAAQLCIRKMGVLEEAMGRQSVETQPKIARMLKDVKREFTGHIAEFITSSEKVTFGQVATASQIKKLYSSIHDVTRATMREQDTIMLAVNLAAINIFNEIVMHLSSAEHDADALIFGFNTDDTKKRQGYYSKYLMAQ